MASSNVKITIKPDFGPFIAEMRTLADAINEMCDKLATEGAAS